MVQFPVKGPVILLAHQRSGTNYFRSVLRSSGLFFDCNEIFLPVSDSVLSPPTNTYLDFNFDRFFARKVAEDSTLLLPSEKNIRKIFADFLTFCSEEAARQAGGGSPLPVLDIKYCASHRLNAYNQFIGHRPFLFQLLREHSLPVIHLIRQDAVAQTISHMLALHSGVYVLEKSAQYTFEPVSLSVEDFSFKLRIREQSLRAIREWFAGMEYGYVLELYYEQLSTLDSFRINAVPVLENAFGISFPENLETPFRKSITDIRATVRNLDQLLEVAASMGASTLLS